MTHGSNIYVPVEIYINSHFCVEGAALYSVGLAKLAIVFAILSAVTGYILAGYGPLWLGAADAVSAAGMIATMSGLILAGAAIWGPCRTRAGAPNTA